MRTAPLALLAGLSVSCSGPGGDDTGSTDTDLPVEPVTLRVATFNTSLFRANAGQLVGDLASGDNAQAKGVAAILQEIRPDVVLLNEVDWDADGEAAARLVSNFLAVGQDGREPLDFPHVFVPTSNTGLHSGLDLDQNGTVESTPGSQNYGGDAWGFGVHEGQYGLVVLSRFPIESTRTFQELLWADMPDNQLPTDWYGADIASKLRLSSKTHADVAITTGGGTLHFLVSHPTPPTFDGSEDRNGRRNHDENVFWTHYVDGADWLSDDAGTSGGLPDGAAFVIAGDLNADPNDGDSTDNPIQALLDHARINGDSAPASEGGAEASERQGGANNGHSGDPANDTADFNDNNVGNLRIDYVLPSTTLALQDSGVFWPKKDDPNFELVGDFPFPISDHRAVWIDVTIGGE